MRSATPRQSKPGPRLEVLAGTRTVICCIGEPRHSGDARDDSLWCGSLAMRAQPATDPLRHADSKYALERQKKMNFGWIDPILLRDFRAEGTDFGTGYSPVLFLEQREKRRYVRHITPKRLLNCFAYTCSFSVSAAYVGAATLNIDLSKKSLARGRENFALNCLPTIEHRFIADDVRAVLR